MASNGSPDDVWHPAEPANPARIMVTGGAGFIGSALCRHLVLEAGARVLNLDCLTYAGNLNSLRGLEGHLGYRFLKTDIRDRPALDHAFAGFRPDAVMHLAAESHVDRSIGSPADFVDTNVMGTVTLLEAARGYWTGLSPDRRSAFRFLHVSTDEVYGSLGPDGLFAETTPYDPSSPYAASKAAADHIVAAWGRTYGLPVLISNCSNNFGPFQFPEKLIPLVVLNAVHGLPLPVYGDGGQVRDWLFVDDHARALDLILRRGRPGARYNVGSRNERRNIDLVREICAILDRLKPSGAPHARLITHVADRPGHDRRYGIDAGKLQSELGWRPAQGFEQALEATVRWYLDNGWWWQPLRAQVYAGERLGLVAEGAR
jgi:dTDP-glucose 4,6-dehydratase